MYKLVSIYIYDQVIFLYRNNPNLINFNSKGINGKLSKHMLHE